MAKADHFEVTSVQRGWRVECPSGFRGLGNHCTPACSDRRVRQKRHPAVTITTETMDDDDENLP